MVRRYHVYKDVWDAATGEELVLQHTCTFISETFIGIDFHEIVMSCEEAKISILCKKPAIRYSYMLLIL